MLAQPTARIVFRPTRPGSDRYVADLIDGRPGFPPFPLVPWGETVERLAHDPILARYLGAHPGTPVEVVS